MFFGFLFVFVDFAVLLILVDWPLISYITWNHLWIAFTCFKCYYWCKDGLRVMLSLPSTKAYWNLGDFLVNYLMTNHWKTTTEMPMHRQHWMWMLVGMDNIFSLTLKFPWKSWLNTLPTWSFLMKFSMKSWVASSCSISYAWLWNLEFVKF